MRAMFLSTLSDPFTDFRYWQAALLEGLGIEVVDTVWRPLSVTNFLILQRQLNGFKPK